MTSKCSKNIKVVCKLKASIADLLISFLFYFIIFYCRYFGVYLHVRDNWISEACRHYQWKVRQGVEIRFKSIGL